MTSRFRTTGVCLLVVSVAAGGAALARGGAPPGTGAVGTTVPALPAEAGWSEIGGGLNSWELPAVVWNEGLYVGGNFTAAGGSTHRRIAMWKDEAWSALDNGLDQPVLALLARPDVLYVGGKFNKEYGTSNSLLRIAKWTGDAWEGVGTGLDEDVWALAWFGDRLIAGGEFDETGNGQTELDHIAYWDGASWEMMDQGFNGDVRALAVYQDQLYAAGAFTQAGDTEMRAIARWTGEEPGTGTWEPVGPGLDSHVWTLTVWDDDLVAGGNFLHTADESVELNRVGRWDTENGWQAFGLGMDDDVVDVIDYDCELYAGGEFKHAGGSGIKYAARWVPNQGRSRSVGNGPDNGTVFGLGLDNGFRDLILGGMFTEAAGDTCQRVGRFVSADNDGDGNGDGCSVNAESDCNCNGALDDFEEPVPDCVNVPPEFDLDGNNVYDACDVRDWPDLYTDCDGNGQIDQLQENYDDDDMNGIPDWCEADCNESGDPDEWEIEQGLAVDDDGDGRIDDARCDNCIGVYNPGQEDCNLDGIGDACELLAGAPDCNGNGVPDACDLGGLEIGLESGNSVDCNGGGIPLECTSRGDVNGQGTVDFSDLLVILAHWDEPGPDGDADCSGLVDFADILLVLANWD